MTRYCQEVGYAVSDTEPSLLSESRLVAWLGFACINGKSMRGTSPNC